MSSSPSPLDTPTRLYGQRLLGLFFRAWAHELNNPVQAVLAGAELIEMELGAPGASMESVHAQVVQHATEIGREVLRVSDGIGRLHALSQGLTRVDGVVEVKSLLDDAIALWNPVARHAGIEVRRSALASEASVREIAVGSCAGRLLVLGALAAIARALDKEKTLDISWREVGGDATRIVLSFVSDFGAPQWVDEEVYFALASACAVQLEVSAGELNLNWLLR